MAESLLFYIFIAFTMLLVWGYFYGKRQNHRIVRNAIDSLVEIVEPLDQKMTNIGGLVGYHIELELPEESLIDELGGTITLLPRQSLLYLPISFIIRKFDRFFIHTELKKSVFSKEAHLFACKFMQKHRKKIADSSSLNKDEITMDGEKFCVCYKNSAQGQELVKLLKSLKNIDQLKEISLYPENNIVDILIIPKPEQNIEILNPIFEWIKNRN